MSDQKVIDGYVLQQTCFACPEQYDVYKDSQLVAYLRLRHGNFTVTVPDVGGEEVFSAFPEGDGIFEDYERDFYLTTAIRAIQMHEKKKKDED